MSHAVTSAIASFMIDAETFPWLIFCVGDSPHEQDKSPQGRMFPHPLLRQQTRAPSRDSINGTLCVTDLMTLAVPVVCTRRDEGNVSGPDSLCVVRHLTEPDRDRNMWTK